MTKREILTVAGIAAATVGGVLALASAKRASTFKDPEENENVNGFGPLDFSDDECDFDCKFCKIFNCDKRGEDYEDDDDEDDVITECVYDCTRCDIGCCNERRDDYDGAAVRRDEYEDSSSAIRDIFEKYDVSKKYKGITSIAIDVIEDVSKAIYNGESKTLDIDITIPGAKSNTTKHLEYGYGVNKVEDKDEI